MRLREEKNEYIRDSAISSSLALTKAVTYSSSTNWLTYLDSTNAYVLTDVFGDPDETPQVVTKIRILVEQFGNSLETLLATDPDINCTGATVLTDAATTELAFYDEITNGTTGDRDFDCVTEEDSETTVYGENSSGTLRIAIMSDTSETNTEEVATRGDTRRIRSVTYATYHEASESSETVGYLDLQYAQSTDYNGVDDAFATSDDVIFKSRSRIVGRVIFDLLGEASQAFGDFTVTKVDVSGGTTTVTQTLGRGELTDAGYSLFNINSDVSSLSSIPGTFCIQTPDGTDDVPAIADSSNCTSYETNYAWGSTAFPYTLSPSIEQDFDDRAFFENDSTDMIASDESNFTIPTY